MKIDDESSSNSDGSQQPEREEGAWFKTLDWNDDDNYANLGVNKRMNRTVNLADVKQLPPG